MNEPVTLWDLQNRIPPTSVAFMDFSDGWAQERVWEIGERRLVVTAYCRGRGRTTRAGRTFEVDGELCANWTNAIDVLNGTAHPHAPPPSITAGPPSGPSQPRAWTFTHRQRAIAASTEAKHRRRVYQRFVDEGHVGWTEERLERGVAVMLDIAAYFARLAEIEERENVAAAEAKAPRLAL